MKTAMQLTTWPPYDQVGVTVLTSVLQVAIARGIDRLFHRDVQYAPPELIKEFRWNLSSTQSIQTMGAFVVSRGSKTVVKEEPAITRVRNYL